MHSSAEHVFNLIVEIRTPFVSSVLCIKIARTTQINDRSDLRKSCQVMCLWLIRREEVPKLKDRMVKQDVGLGFSLGLGDFLLSS